MNEYLVFDIGGTNVKYGLLTEDGKIIEKDQVKTPGSWEEMKNTLDLIINQYNNQISGIGFSAPGKIDTDRGIIYKGGAVGYLDKVNIKEYIKKNYDLPSSVINDGKAAGQAELWQGNLKGVKDAISMTLGTGVGGAVIVDGQVHQGHNFLSGEFSSYLFHEGQNSETLARKASAILLVKKLANILGLEDESDGKKVFEIVNLKENKKVNTIFEDYCKNLARFIVNMKFIFDMSHVVIGGGISKQEIVIDEIKKQYEQLVEENPVLTEIYKPIEIKSCKFSNDSNLLGALYQLLLEFEK